MALGDVKTQINWNKDWADESLKSANTFLDVLKNNMTSQQVNRLTEYGFAPINVTVDQVNDNFSAAEPVNHIIPSFNSKYQKGSIYTPANISIPTLNVAAPAVTIPAAPVANLPATPTSPAPIVKPNIPLSPAVALPTLPVLSNITLPIPPATNIPQFTSALPQLNLIPPQANFNYTETPYSSPLLTKLLNFLSKKLDGGTGLNKVVENELWDRARSREAIANEEVMRNAVEGFAAQGFQFPSGALQERIARATSESEQKTSALSRDISIKQAELEQENDKIYSQTVFQVEGMLIQHSDKVADRMLDVAKTRVTLSIALFDAQVAQYNAEIAKYKVQSEVYRDLIQAALTTAEIYKIEVEGAKLSIDIQKLYVELYNAQLKGVDSLIGIYKGEMEGARIAMDIEKTYIEGYRANISAYQSLVQSKVAEFNMYSAQIDGEKAKVDIYRAQVDSFNTEVNAQKAVAEIEKIKLSSSVESERSNIESYRASISAYTVELAGIEANIRASTSIYGAKVSGYSAQMQAKLGNASLHLKGLEAHAQQDTQRVQLIMQQAAESTKLLLKEVELDERAAEFGANSYAQMASAAASGMNTMLQLAEDSVTQG